MPGEKLIKFYLINCKFLTDFSNMRFTVNFNPKIASINMKYSCISKYLAAPKRIKYWAGVI